MTRVEGTRHPTALRRHASSIAVLSFLAVFSAITTMAAIQHAHRWSSQAAVVDVAESGDVSQALLKLLRTQDITPEVFTCPATQPSQMEFGAENGSTLNWSNGSATSAPLRNLSYRYQNPFTTR